jgi:hypothetical protein
MVVVLGKDEEVLESLETMRSSSPFVSAMTNSSVASERVCKGKLGSSPSPMRTRKQSQ